MAAIELTQGYSAIVDDSDAPALSSFKWYAHASAAGKVYAARRTYDKGRRGLIYMHRQIMGSPPRLDVDHLSGDTLDNRRKNLRAATRSQNLLNGAGSVGRGFFKCKQTGRWFTRISFDGRRIMLGRFQSREQAAMAVGIARVLLAEGCDVKSVPARVSAQISRFPSSVSDLSNELPL